MKKIFSFVFLFCLVLAAPAYSATMVDIYGPGQNIVNLSMAKPLTAPNVEAKGLGVDLDSKIRYNLSYLPFMNLVPDVNILGGTVLSAWSGANLDFRRFQIGGADLLITAYWPGGDSNGSKVELRVFETFSGKFIFGNAYNNITDKETEAVADKFCADLMKVLTGSGDFFLSTLTFLFRKVLPCLRHGLLTDAILYSATLTKAPMRLAFGKVPTAKYSVSVSPAIRLLVQASCLTTKLQSACLPDLSLIFICLIIVLNGNVCWKTAHLLMFPPPLTTAEQKWFSLPTVWADRKFS